MKILAIVPARSGSKGLPNKNLAKIGNKTLLELAIKVGLDCKIIDDVYVSTDCKEHERKALSAGAKSLGLRSKEYATDISNTIDVVIDLIKKLEKKYDFLVLLQPTSPIREPRDIENIIDLIKEKNADACVSVTQFEEPHPFKLKSIANDGYIMSFLDGKTSEIPRQLLPKVYALNGAIYVTKVKKIIDEKTFLPKKNHREFIFTGTSGAERRFSWICCLKKSIMKKK
mgnify:CR=1 FL=1